LDRVILQYRDIIFNDRGGGTLLAHLIGALVVWLVMQCLGEFPWRCRKPARSVYAARHSGPATGYTAWPTGWLLTVALGSSLLPLGSACSTGSRRCPSGRGVVVFFAVIFGLNVISTRSFAEGEFWFSVSDHHHRLYYSWRRGTFGFIPMQDGSPAPGLTILPLKAGSRTAACRS
jgi:S-methylmethionine transporter